MCRPVQEIHEKPLKVTATLIFGDIPENVSIKINLNVKIVTGSKDAFMIFFLFKICCFVTHI